MITGDVLRSAGRLAFGGASVALVGLLLFLACNRESTTAEIAGPEEPAPEEVGDGPLSLANLTLPFQGSTSANQTAFSVSQGGASAGSGLFRITSSTNEVAALIGYTAGKGTAVVGWTVGTGSAGRFLNVSGNSATVLDATAAGTGTAINGLAIGGGSAGAFRISNANTLASALSANTNAKGPAVFGGNNGTGGAALFVITSTSNTQPALEISTLGKGEGLKVDHHGSSGSLAVFQVNNNNRIRFNLQGKGFFNGGTQMGGADVAEAFAVEGRASAYEPGDVLVISARSDRRVEKTTESYSTRVVGVYATKPGVLLTERGIDDGLEGLVPVGVIGVIPTKVSTENGPIRRGDLLVTASRPGHAMRATPVVIQGVTLYPTGAILGRALEEFRGPGTGVITALVNVK